MSDESHTLRGLIQRGYEIHMLVPRAPGLMSAEPGLHVHTFRNVLALPGWLPAPVKRLWLLPAFWSVAGNAANTKSRMMSENVRVIMEKGRMGRWRSSSVRRKFGAAEVNSCA